VTVQPEPDGALLLTEEAPRRLVPGWGRMALGMLAGLAITVVVILIFNPSIEDDVEAASRATVQPLYLLGALACVAVYLAADAWSLVVLARACCQTPARGVVKIALEAHFVGGASSFGGAEIPFQVFMLRRLGMSGSQATSAVVVKGLVHAALLAVVALVSLLPWTDSPITSLQRWLLLVVTLVLAGVWLGAWLWMRRPLGRGLLPARLRAKADGLVVAVRSFGGSRRVWVELVVLQLVYWVAMFGVLLFVLHALGWRGSVVPIITGQAVMQVLMPLSPLPGGAGVAELSYLALIGPSTAPSIRVSSLVLWRLLTWLVPVAIGGLLIGLRGAHHGRRRTS
jgi:uncharacterized membrane protein YbhN (UPF0104 family)